jgi:GT2 family glycosyltransferase
MDPLITTIIPTYRRPSMLRRAIRSALAQSWTALKVRVYDNAGDPENAAVVAAFDDPRLEYFRHAHNLGAFANFQFGLGRVNTPFFSFLADDDILLPDFYATAMKALEHEPTAAFAATRVVRVDRSGRMLALDGAGLRSGSHRPPEGLLALVEGGHINWVGILFRRSSLEAVPALDERTAPSFDLDFELRLAARSAFVVCEEPGALLVQHEGSASVEARLSDTWPAFLQIIDNATASDTMPAAIRQRARTAMDRELAGRLYRIGRAAARQGRVIEAHAAAALIAQRYGWHRRAVLVRVAARICAALPPTRSALRLALEGYRLLRARQLRASGSADYGTRLRS